MASLDWWIFLYFLIKHSVFSPAPFASTVTIAPSLNWCILLFCLSCVNSLHLTKYSLCYVHCFVWYCYVMIDKQSLWNLNFYYLQFLEYVVHFCLNLYRVGKIFKCWGFLDSKLLFKMLCGCVKGQIYPLPWVACIMFPKN